ncbi:MAG: alpha/beta hydrolase [Candidatus Omnitrophota bacterium]
MRKLLTFLNIWPVLIILSIVPFLFPASAQADEASYIIVHVHNPEGIEIASIPNGVDTVSSDGSQGAEIYDGDNFIAGGAYNTGTHCKPIEISSGSHTIKAKFNGMTKEEDVTLDPGQTKIVVFTFQRTNRIDDVAGSFPMNYNDTVSASGWTDVHAAIWENTDLYSMGGDFDVMYCTANISLTVAGSVTSLGDNRFRMEHHIAAASSSFGDSHPPAPNVGWGFVATGFSLINKVNYHIDLPHTCDRWFIQGWGLISKTGCASLEDSDGNQTGISSFLEDVPGHYYTISVPYGIYHIRAGFKLNAGQYWRMGSVMGNPEQEYVTPGCSQDVEFPRYVTDVPYNLSGAGLGNQLIVEGGTDKESYGINDEVKISCVVKDGTSGEILSADTIIAEITLPDGSKEEVSLSEVETGKYEGAFTGTSQVGSYSIGVDAKKADYADGTKEIDFPATMLEILDGSSFSSGAEISDSPEKLVSIDGIKMKGVAADGAARLLLRIKTGVSAQVSLSLEGGTGDKSEDGVLRSIDRKEKQEGNSIEAHTVSTSKGDIAFAIYQAPVNFVRGPDDTTAPLRSMMLRVVVNSDDALAHYNFLEDIRIARPPVVFIHGIWSSQLCWLNFENKVYDAIPGIYTVIADYEATNADYFTINMWVVRQYLNKARAVMRESGIAMVRADIVAHSMGGILSRLWSCTGSGPCRYLRDDNFHKGDINKLISIDSPYLGSFLSDVTLFFMRNYPNKAVVDLFTKLAGDLKQPVDKGAVTDLATDSLILQFINSHYFDMWSHAIAGDYIVPGGDFDLIGDPSLRLMHKAYKIAGVSMYEYIVDGRSDLVVSLHSQFGGLHGAAITTYNHDHMNFKTQEVVDSVVFLLNSKASDEYFHKGYIG